METRVVCFVTVFFVSRTHKHTLTQTPQGGVRARWIIIFSFSYVLGQVPFLIPLLSLAALFPPPLLSASHRPLLAPQVFTALLAWIIIPNMESSSIAGWRFFLVLCALPALSCAIMLAFPYFPASPAFLLAQGRPAECLSVLQQVYRLNNPVAA